jgi:NADH-quinone oxidoreductase subunit M
MLQDRAHTREMERFGGLLKVIPALGWSFILAAFASLGLPGLAHFPAEFQIFLATLEVRPWAVIVVLGIVVTAGLYLRAIGLVFLGETREQWRDLPDLDRREWLTLAPLLLLIIAIGVAPAWVLDTIHQTTAALALAPVGAPAVIP